MTYLTGDICIAVGKHRLYPYFENLLIVSSGLMQGLSFTHALERTQNMATITVYKSDVHYKSNLFDVWLTLPQSEPLQLVIRGQTAHVVKLHIGQVQRSDASHSIPSGPLNIVFANAIAPTFVQFFEDNKAWVKANNWPGVWNFGRVVRNAMSHGGTLKINDPNASTVTWHHVSYGFGQNKRVIGTELLFADIMILMLEMAGDLDRLGCPIARV